MSGSSQHTIEGHTFHHSPEAVDADVQLSRLFENISHALNVMLAGTGRNVSCDTMRKTVTINGGIELRGYGPVTERHASSIIQLITPELLTSWGFESHAARKVQKVLMAICGTLPEVSSSGGQHEYSYKDVAISPQAVRNYLELSDNALRHIHEKRVVKDAGEELRAQLASLVLQGSAGTAMPVELRKGVVNEGEFVDGVYVVTKKPALVGGAVKPALRTEFGVDHINAFLKKLDAVGLSNYASDVLEAVALERRVRAGNFSDDTDDEFSKTGGLEALLLKVQERIADVAHQYIEKTKPSIPTILRDGAPVAIPIVNEGYTFDHLLIDEHNVERLRDEVAALTERLQVRALPKELHPILDAAHDAVRAALDRSSTDGYRFNAARAALITARDALTAEGARRESVQRDIQALLKPLSSWEHSILSALKKISPGLDTPASVRAILGDNRYTGEEIVEIERAVVVLQKVHALKNARYESVAEARTALDASALQEKIVPLCQSIFALSNTPSRRLEKASRALESLKRGILETNSHHRVSFTRSGDLITFIIPTQIARVVAISNNPTQTHSGNYQSLQSAIAYANASLLTPPNAIIGLEERASEPFVDAALLSKSAETKRFEAVRHARTSLRTKVKHALAAVLGGVLGATVTLPDAPRREPTHDVDTDSEATRTIQRTVVEQTGFDNTRVSPGEFKITVPVREGTPERIITLDIPQPSVLDRRTLPIEIDSARIKLHEAFTAPVTSEHGTYALLSLLRMHTGESRTLTPTERRATDWFTHAFSRYVNESPDERIGQLTKGLQLPRGVIASTIPAKYNGKPVQLAFGEILQDKTFWQWFDAFYAKRKTTSLAQPGLAGLAESIEAVAVRLKKDFGVNP